MPKTLEEAASALYRSILRREPTPSELEQANERAEQGEDVSDLALSLSGSREAERYHARLFVPPGHFYSPIVDPKLVESRVRRKREPVLHPLPGLALDLERMVYFWEEYLAPHARHVPFPETPSADFRYHLKAPAYGYGDAIVLNAMILHFRPRRFIEVGCGWSSACTLDSVCSVPDLQTELTFIEPYPTLLEKVIWGQDRARIEIISAQVQEVPVSTFQRLEARDILFIDSTHVLKTGSDVWYELSEVLPSLNSGVIIHFHDIFYPFEYGYNWVVEQNRSWNELYALRLFMAFNSAFEVLFFNDMFAQLKRDIIERDCPLFLKNSGGSIWMRRKP
jgi:hypothetical protein